jgi:hypothetical protein
LETETLAPRQRLAKAAAPLNKNKSRLRVVIIFVRHVKKKVRKEGGLGKSPKRGRVVA